MEMVTGTGLWPVGQGEHGGGARPAAGRDGGSVLGCGLHRGPVRRLVTCPPAWHQEGPKPLSPAVSLLGHSRCRVPAWDFHVKQQC